MNQHEFEDTLRQFKHRNPFEPFVVEMVDGRLIEINGEGLDFGERAAPWLSPTHGIVHLTCETVRVIRKRTMADFPKLAAEIARKQGRSEAGMHPTQFDDTLRKLIRREPFMPFVVEMLDGKLISVNEPTLVFCGGAALYISEEGLARFECEEVREIRQATQEAVA